MWARILIFGMPKSTVDFAWICLHFWRAQRFPRDAGVNFTFFRWSAWRGVFFSRCTQIRSSCMSNGKPSGQVVLPGERPQPSNVDVEFPRYPPPRGIDIYSRLLLPHSSTPVTQLTTPTIARWWGCDSGRDVDVGEAEGGHWISPGFHCILSGVCDFHTMYGQNSNAHGGRRGLVYFFYPAHISEACACRTGGPAGKRFRRCSAFRLGRAIVSFHVTPFLVASIFTVACSFPTPPPP